MILKRHAVFFSLGMFLLIFFFVACTITENTETQTGKITENNVTFIFHGFSPLSHIKKFNSGAELEINDVPDLIFWDGLSLVTFAPTKNDTNSFVIHCDQIIFSHRINLTESFEFLFRKGDSILFSYENGYPEAKVLNREFKKFDLNWERKFRSKRFTITEPSTAAKYKDPELASESFVFIDHNKNKTKLYPLFSAELKEETEFLDSLLIKDLISKEVNFYFKERSRYNALALDVDNNKLDSSQAKKIMSDQNEPSTNPYTPFGNFVRIVVAKFFIEKVKIINAGNSFYRDYRIVYDNIEKSQLFPKNIKDRVLFQQVVQIADNFSLSDFRKYYEKFKNEKPDTALISKINSTYLMDFDELRKSSENLYLVGLRKQKSTLDSVKNEHKGKLIYVDFWASWCGPCRQAMPASKSLMKKYAGKVDFVYLSSDRDFDKWKDASVKEGMEFYKDSYLMVNPQKSEFLTKLNFKEIPRYMLFDEAGKLIHQRAPGPESNEIEKIFESNLKN